MWKKTASYHLESLFTIHVIMAIKKMLNFPDWSSLTKGEKNTGQPDLRVKT